MDEQHSPRPTEETEPVATYEIRLRGAHVPELREQFPAAALATTRTETVLSKNVNGPEELDALIAQLLSMGLVLTEVHELHPPDAPVAVVPSPAKQESIP